MKHRTFVFAVVAIAVFAAVLARAWEEPGGNISSRLFRHHFITSDIPQTKAFKWGYGSPVLADFDRDGDLDYAFSTREESLYWFENQGPDSWVRHEAASVPVGQLGAAGMDVDRDGSTDVVIGGVWYRTPGNPKEAPFARYIYDASVKGEIHDVVTADMDGDGRDDVVVYGEEFGCYWYRVPNGPASNAAWPRTVITLAGLKTGPTRIHSGIAPHGIGDLDGDGDADVVLPDRWLENAERGRKWTEHKLPFGKVGGYGLSSRSWIADMNRDGHPDIVITDSDQVRCSAAWLENDGGKPPSFRSHPLPLSAPGVRGSFHSLVVADFDGNGSLDIFTVEQEDPTILPSGASPRWYIWENLDGRGGRFAERVIYDGKLGGHDVIPGDIDGDGDLDFVSKVWFRWPGNANGGRFHADWFENRLKAK